MNVKKWYIQITLDKLQVLLSPSKINYKCELYGAQFAKWSTHQVYNEEF